MFYVELSSDSFAQLPLCLAAHQPSLPLVPATLPTPATHYGSVMLSYALD